MLRPANRVGWVRGDDLADNHPIEEHPKSGQSQLYGGLGLSLELGLDEGRDVDWFDLGEILDAVVATEGGKLPDSLPVGVDPTLLSPGAIWGHRLVAAGSLKPHNSSGPSQNI